MAKELLPYGLDDLTHGVEQLLQNCFSEAERQNVAQRILHEIRDFPDDVGAVKWFRYAVREFAMSGEAPHDVRRWYIAFLEQVGPIIGAHNKAVMNGAKGGKQSAHRARAESAAEIEAALKRLMKMKPDVKEHPFRNVQQLAKYMHAAMLPGIPVDTLRRWLVRSPDLPLVVESLPMKLRKGK